MTIVIIRALLRSGRVDLHHLLIHPTVEDVIEYLTIRMKKLCRHSTLPATLLLTHSGDFKPFVAKIDLQTWLRQVAQSLLGR